MPRLRCFSFAYMCAAAIWIAAASADERRPSLLDDPNVVPTAVWLQQPANAERYRTAGINLYVGLWKGPTEAQLAQLRQADMPVICHQNELGLRHRDNATIVGWMHHDEPDNAQSLGEGKGYGPPVSPQRIVDDYRRMKLADPTRPVLLNLGQGVAWDGWHGRGVRTNKPEDYPLYVQGCDIASFDIYPVAHPHRDVQGKLWYVGVGVQRLREWTQPAQRVWTCIETSRINSTQKANGQQIRTQVWMAVAHGATGFIYFVHEWQPRFNEHALLDDPQNLAAVTAINAELQRLAPVINSPSITEGVSVTTASPDAPVKVIIKRHNGALYVFAVAMRDGKTTARITLPIDGDGEAELLDDEARRVPVRAGVLEDSFGPYEVRLYRVRDGGNF